MSEQNTDRTIEIPMSKEDEILRLGLNEYKGRTFVGIRKWYRRPGQDFGPTRAGLTVSGALRLLAAMNRLDFELPLPDEAETLEGLDPDADIQSEGDLPV